MNNLNIYLEELEKQQNESIKVEEYMNKSRNN